MDVEKNTSRWLAEFVSEKSNEARRKAIVRRKALFIRDRNADFTHRII